MAWVKQHKAALLGVSVGSLAVLTGISVWLLYQVLAGDQQNLPGKAGMNAPMQAKTDAALSKADYERQMPLFLRLFKQDSLLEMWGKQDGRWFLLKTYEICRWAGKLGPKQREGDHQSPEGFYLVGKKQLNPNSDYHLSFNLGFPNVVEQAQGRTGSYLMVHGGCQSAGCYAMTDEGVEEIYRMVEAALSGGQQAVPVHVFPFHLTAEALAGYAADERLAFWQTLQPAYQAFEDNRTPPVIFNCGTRYGLRATAGCPPLKSW